MKIGKFFGTVAGAATLGAWVTMQVLRRKRRMDFGDKVVLITGGSRGLGLILARLFLREGARVAICGRTQADLDAARDELQLLGDIRAYRIDLRDLSQIESLFERVEGDLGPVDVLVNCAAVMTLGPLETMTPADFENEMDIGFRATLHTMLRAWPGMKERGGGRIVNISSVGGRVALPHLVAYSANKHAVSGLSQGFRVELERYGVLVTTVWPMIMRLGSIYSSEVKGQQKKEWALANLFNSNPLTSISGERCAKGIVEATRVGLATYNPSKRAGFFALAHALAPNVVLEVLSLVPRIWPGPGREEFNPNEKIKGKELLSPLSPSVLTVLNDAEAVKNNELNREYSL